MNPRAFATLLVVGLAVAACGDSNQETANEAAAAENGAQAGNGASASDGSTPGAAADRSSSGSVPDEDLPQPITPPPPPTPIPAEPQANTQEPPPALEQDYLNRNKQSGAPSG